MTEWHTMVSDPALFTTLIANYGVEGIQVEEILSMEEEMFVTYPVVYGLILLHKWMPQTATNGNILDPNEWKDLFFAQQAAQNMCATVALLNIILNCSENINIGAKLKTIKEQCQNMSLFEKGKVIANDEDIRTIHNLMAQSVDQMSVPPTPPILPSEDSMAVMTSLDELKLSDSFDMNTLLSISNMNTFHYAGYIPFQGHVLELDGLKEGPIDHGKFVDGSNWIEIARQIILQRMGSYNKEEVHFNLMALVPSTDALDQPSNNN